MSLIKAVFINLDDKFKVPVPVLFNPEGYTITRSNHYKEHDMIGGVVQQNDFMGQNLDQLDLDLFFDTTDSGEDVRIQAYRVIRLSKKNDQTGKPPKLMFAWGTLLFECMMVSVQQQYEQFSYLGWPLRARLKVVLKGRDNFEGVLDHIPPVLQLAGQVAKEAKDVYQAAREQSGDPKNWRPIAEARSIVNPLTTRF